MAILLGMGNFILNHLEFFSAILALLCVWLAAINHILNWPVAMISSVGYIGVFFESQLYSDAFLNTIFLFFQAYGWFRWRNQEAIRPHPLNKPKMIRYVLFFSLMYIPWVVFITRYLPWLPSAIMGSGVDVLPSPRFPWLDAALMMLSLLALMMQSQRWIEHWYLWILVDIIYVPIYYYSGNTITAILYFLYIGLAGYGLNQWRKLSRFPANTSTN